ncbi:MAG: FtsX-like permease family protein [Patescibacteria group bacterium]
MTFSSLLLVLKRQFTQKWGRFLLASGGIMIGIWAITLTTSLSLGVSDAIIDAINSQPIAREISISVTESGQTSYDQINETPKFIPLSEGDLQEIVDKYPEVLEVSPVSRLNFFVQTPAADKNIKCVEKNLEMQAQLASQAQAGGDVQVSTANMESGAESLSKDCLNINVSSNTFKRFYESNRTNWYGKQEEPAKNEVVACFKCGSTQFGEALGVEKPEDLVGKKITIELQRAPELYEGGKVLDVLDFNTPDTEIKESKDIELTISAVVDDTDAGIFGSNNFYVGYNYFQDAFKLANPDLNPSNYGTVQNTVFIDSYQNLDAVVDDLRNDKFLTLSIAQEIIKGVSTGFLVLSAALSMLGFIALVASVFGIINVMTISVLERQKEIGVLKSLGARDGDIFRIFLFESSLLGIIGWLLGISLAAAIGNLLSFIFVQVIENDPGIRANLESINLSSFTPSFPWWLLLGSLAISLVFTVLSGVFPAIKASKQNPVDVLRSE